MTYTREQRAANAAKAAAREASTVAPQQSEPEAPSENNPNLRLSEPRPPARNEARSAAFAEIEARHDKTSGNAPPEPEPKPAEPPKPVEPEPVQQPPEPAQEPQPEPVAEVESQPEVEMLTVKIDGETFSVPKSEVDEVGGVRAYQTIRAADNRLRKANETLAQTRQMQAYLATLTAQNAPKPEAPKRVTADEAFQAIRFGTPEEGLSTLNTLIQQAVGKPIDPQQLMRETMVETAKINAAKQFQKEFADISGNPLLYKLAVQIDRERMEEAFRAGHLGPQFDFPEYFRKIGNEIRGAFGRSSQPASTSQTASSPSQPSDKEARKASIVNLPSSSARAELPAEAKPETHEEIMNSYRKSRGQTLV